MEAGRPTPAQLIEGVGFGRAQLATVFLSASGIHFCDAILLSMMNVLTRAMAVEFNLRPTERAMMTTLTFTGLFVGTSAVGYLGDTFGRRFATLGCYLISSSFAFITAFMPNFGCVMFSCILLGFGIGIGFPPSIALVSEMTPQQWRIPMRIASTLSYICAGLIACGILALDDPWLRHLHWRTLLWIVSLVPAAWGLLAFFFLRESPVFLASVGRHEEAKKVFAWLQWLNKKADKQNPSAIDYEQIDTGVHQHTLTFREQLSEVFSRNRCFTTLGMAFALFCLQINLYGAQYAAPQILERAGTLAPVVQILINNIVALCFALVIGVIAQLVTRKQAMMLSLFLGALVPICFAWAGSQPKPRSALENIIFQIGSNGQGFTVQLGMVAGYQLAVEAYPATCATTSSSIIQGAGRLGAIVAPQLYENITHAAGTWTVFFYVLAVLSGLGGLAVSAAPLRSEEGLQPVKADKLGYGTHSVKA